MYIIYNTMAGRESAPVERPELLDPRDASQRVLYCTVMYFKIICCNNYAMLYYTILYYTIIQYSVI